MNVRNVSLLLGALLLVACGASRERETFQLSASVADSCRPPDTPAAYCVPLRRFLAELSAEPRDAEWASAMESRIEKSLLVKGRRAGEIRSLECRRTLCAVEYVIDPEHVEQADGDAALELAMEPRIGGIAYESGGASGRHHLVTVMCWQKRREQRA